MLKQIKILLGWVKKKVKSRDSKETDLSWVKDRLLDNSWPFFSFNLPGFLKMNYVISGILASHNNQLVIFYLITNLVALIKIWTKHTWSITTRPHMLRIRLEVNSPGNSFGTESLLPPLVVSVFKLDKATRTTQAGWKLRPWIREASKVFIFVISMEANVSENRKRDKLYNDSILLSAFATLFP